jgi:hypothetical protein
LANKLGSPYLPPSIPQFGNLIAQCGPGKTIQGQFFGIGTAVFAVLCFIAPMTFLTPKPGDEKVLWMVCSGAGVFFALLSTFLLALPYMEKPQVSSLSSTGSWRDAEARIANWRIQQ